MSCCGSSLISRPCGHFDKLCSHISHVCHTDTATLHHLCQPAESLFPMPEKDADCDSEGILSNLIKLNSLPKAFPLTAKHFYVNVTLPLCTTPDGIFFPVLKCQ